MTNDLMERRLSAALDKTAPDDVAGVLSRCTERKGTVVPMKKKNQRMKKWMQAMAACLAVLLLGGGVLVQQAHAVTSVVSLDVNPSIELRVNSREKVVSCQALNDEAAAVLADMDGGRDLKGVKADVAVNAIVGSLVRCGYLDSLSSAILISVEDKDQARAQRLQQELTSVAGGALGDSQAAVLSQTVQQDKDLEKLAKANHISTGKAAPDPAGHGPQQQPDLRGAGKAVRGGAAGPDRGRGPGDAHRHDGGSGGGSQLCGSDHGGCCRRGCGPGAGRDTRPL